MRLHNDFHGTSVQINLRGGKAMSKYQVRRAWKALCGIKTCQCGGVAGERGARNAFRTIPRSDGGADLEERA